ncbi:MAG: redoxin domain-containing protein [Planctomycetes bacterium]|nr:redoxin domain-containing protein [Planctomycetota bacterium]
MLVVCASPLLAANMGGQTGKKKEAPKKEQPKPKPPEHKQPPAAKTAAIGAEVDGAIALEDPAGKAHALKEYRGKIVVLDFWSSTSSGDAQQKHLAKIAQEFAGKNVTVIGIDSVAGEATDVKAVEAAVAKNAVGFPVLLDKEGRLAGHLGAKALDEVFVLDAKGVLRYSGSIDDDPKGEKADKAQDYLSAALRAVVEGKDAPTPTTAPNGAALKAAEGKKAPAPPAGKK